MHSRAMSSWIRFASSAGGTAAAKKRPKDRTTTSAASPWSRWCRQCRRCISNLSERRSAKRACAVIQHRVWWAALPLLSVVLLAPLLITDVPPLLDYPNHLARFVLLAAARDDPVLGPVFMPHWAIIPNLAADVIVPPLLHLMPVHVAGRCFLGAVLLLNLAGVIALHGALFRRLSLWPLASGLAAYNSTLLLGFLNWQIGSCGRYRRRSPAALVYVTNVPQDEAPASVEHSAYRLSPVRIVANRTRRVLASAVRQSRTTADPFTTRLRHAC